VGGKRALKARKHKGKIRKLAGKPIGILLASLLVVKVGKVPLPEHTNWSHMLGAAILGGVGFTMAIFVANLAYAEAATVAAAKIGILAGSMVAGVAGFLVLLSQARKAEAHGITYVQTAEEDEDLLAASEEFAQRGAYCEVPPHEVHVE
jgi:NhaA family Na+:H+ antiporter